MTATLWARFYARATGMRVPVAGPEQPLETDDPYRDYVNNSLIASPRADRQSANVVQIESHKLLPLLFAFQIVTMVVAIYANGKADRATDEARHMERENRVMQDDLKYVRAYLSARGIDIPANHEEAEESK